MKITKEHYTHIKTEIDKVLATYPNLIEEYETGNFPRADKVNNLQERFCFDLLYGAGLSRYVSDNISPYANGDHLFTALRKATPTITKRY
jgi:hypothetical protein